MRAAFALLVILITAPLADAAKSDLTDPTTTCTVIGQMIQDMAIGLGSVISEVAPLRNVTGPSIGGGKPRPLGSIVYKGAFKAVKVKRDVHKETKHNADDEVEEGEVGFKPQTYRYRGSQIWGDAEAVIVTNENSFDIKVTCSLPVNYWALYSGDGTMIKSGKLREVTSFASKINEMFTAPYTLTLNVIYNGIANQVRVDLK